MNRVPSITLSPAMRRMLFALGIVVVFALGALERFSDLRRYPAWLPDECAAVSQASEFPRFPLVWNGVRHSCFPHQPGALAAFSVAMDAMGRDIGTLRLVSAVSGMMCLCALILIGHEAGGGRAALLAGLFFAFHPLAANINRMGQGDSLATAFSYWGVYLALHGIRKDRRAIIECGIVLCALAPVFALSAMPNALGLALGLPGSRQRRMTRVAAVAAILLAATGAWAHWGTDGLYWEDVRIWLAWMGDPNASWLDVFARLRSALMDTGGMSAVGPGGWTILGAGGLLLLRRRPARSLLPCLAVLNWVFLGVVSLNRPSLAPLQGLPFVALACVGAAFAALQIVSLGRRQLREQAVALGASLSSARFAPAAWRDERRSTKVATFACSAPALLLLGGLGAYVFQPAFFGHPVAFANDTARLGFRPTDELEELQEWLKANTKPDDLLVIDLLDWMAPCRTTPVLYAALASGLLTPDFIPPDFKRRFVEDCRLEDATFLVTQPMHYALSQRFPELRAILDPFLARPPVFFIEQARVFANPARGVESRPVSPP